MSEELKFQKLSEVELVEEAPEGSHPLVEHNGKIKRVTGGLGGGKGEGIPVFDLTPYIYLTEEKSTLDRELLEQGLLIIRPEFTEQDVEEFLKLASAGMILVHADLNALFELGAGDAAGTKYTIDQVFSTQFFDSGSMLDTPMKGVCLYSGVAEAFLLNSSAELLSVVGSSEGLIMAQFVFPYMLANFLG